MIETILITGLPAAGRSTAMMRLLTELEDARCAVCIHRHARAFGLETTLLPVDAPPCVHYSEVYDFGSGCLCCSPDGDLSRLLNELRGRQDELKLTHLLIETTGVADPNPFIKLFEEEPNTVDFTLRSVLCVVDLLRAASLLDEHRERGAETAGSRGLAQIRSSDVLVLNHADELKAERAAEHVDATKKMLLELSETSRPMLGPYSYCKSREPLLASLATRSRPPARACSQALPAPGMFQLRFGPGVHDGACSTCCLVRRGVSSLEAFLAMLQLLLDSGEAYRIQGYISFLPEKRSTSRGDVYPPAPERLWAMPMVVVQGYYRGRLEIAEVSRASDANPMQESAFDSAAADRGGCKVFLCGRRLDDAELKAQLKRCVAPGYDLVCNLEQAWPEAAQAMEHLEQQATQLLKRSTGSRELKVAKSGRAREDAEAFAEALRTEFAGLESVELPEKTMRCRGGELQVTWRQGVVSVGTPTTRYETLVLGSDVYIRPAA